LGQIGRHSPEHAKAVAEANALGKLLECYTSAESSDDLKTKSKRALKSIIEKCTTLAGKIQRRFGRTHVSIFPLALEPLIDSPPNIQQYVMRQFAKILPNDSKAKRDFVTNGCLQKIQLIQVKLLIGIFIIEILG
jgi:hypothetical protein